MSIPIEETRTVVIEKVFPHAPEKVWRALTESKLLSQWLLQNDFEAEVGRKFAFRNEPMPQWDGVIECEVLVVEPMTRLSYSWSAMGLDSVVLFTLATVEGGTQLRMEHSGFGPAQDQAFKGATYGWRKFLGGLETVLEGGEG